MNRVSHVALGDLCTFTGGGTPSRKQPDYFSGDIPWATVKDFKHFTIEDTEEHINEQAVRDSAANIVERGSVLLVTRVGLGKVAVAGTRLAINQDIKAVQPNADLDPAFLFWFLLSQAERLQSMGTGATVKGITLNDVRAIRCPVPPLREQHRIVDLLSRAESIVRLRREAQRKAAELIPAIFLDMFGDPIANPRRWSITHVGDLGLVQLGRQRSPKYQTGKFTRSYVRVANVLEDRIDTTDLLSMDFDDRDFKQYRLEHGDILLNEGQSTELVGRPAMWRNEVAECCFQNTLIRFQPDRAKLVSEFSLAAMLNYYRSGVLSRISSKTSSVAHLGAARFAKLPLYVPPIDLQHQFAAKAEAVRGIIARQTAALVTAQATFDALLHRAFAD